MTRRDNSGIEDGVGRCYRRAFTLIELLVVVAIIMILTGISMKITSLVTGKTGKARTIWVLEQVKNALGSYYVAYGSYPPVDTVTYIFEGAQSGNLPAVPDGGMGYSTGLVFYIYNAPRHNSDPVVATWQHYLTGIGSYGSQSNAGKASASFIAWTNNTHTILDGWGNEIGYQCKALNVPGQPANQRFRLWSSGNGSVIEVTSD